MLEIWEKEPALKNWKDEVQSFVPAANVVDWLPSMTLKKNGLARQVSTVVARYCSVLA